MFLFARALNNAGKRGGDYKLKIENYLSLWMNRHIGMRSWISFQP